jgi:transcriptional regulator with XRE-family HTH domain
VDKLADLRESQALTLRDLAERSGVDANTINQIELGHRKPRPSTLRKLAKALDVEVAEFFEESGRTSHNASSPPLSFKAWLEERCGSAYLAMSMEELKALFESLDNTEKETEKRREIFDKIHREYLATTKTKDLPAEERVMVRGHHKAASSKWTLALSESGLQLKDEEAEKSIRDALSAAG